MGEMKALSFLLFMNSVDLNLQGRELHKVAEQEAQGSPGSRPSLGSPMRVQLWGSVPGGEAARCLNCLCYLLASLVSVSSSVQWRW